MNEIVDIAASTADNEVVIFSFVNNNKFELLVIFHYL